MTVEVRILLIGLAVFAGTGLIAAMLVPLVGGRWIKGTAAQRASRLADLRLLPSMAALTASVIVAGSFLAFEPQWDGEDVGVAVPLLAAFATLLLGTAAWRVRPAHQNDPRSDRRLAAYSRAHLAAGNFCPRLRGQQ